MALIVKSDPQLIINTVKTSKEDHSLIMDSFKNLIRVTAREIEEAKNQIKKIS